MYRLCRTVIFWVSFLVAFKRLQTLFLSTADYNEEMIIRYVEKLLKDHTLFIFLTYFTSKDLEFTELEILRLRY